MRQLPYGDDNSSKTQVNAIARRRGRSEVDAPQLSIILEENADTLAVVHSANGLTFVSVQSS